MALPNAGEIWTANTTSLETADDFYVYKVEEIITDPDSVEWAVVKQMGPSAGGFRKRVKRAYMDASANWTLQSAPIP